MRPDIVQNDLFAPSGNYLFKVNNRNSRTRCKICAKVTIKHQNDAYFTSCCNVSIVNFEQENTAWGSTFTML